MAQSNFIRITFFGVLLELSHALKEHLFCGSVFVFHLYQQFADPLTSTVATPSPDTQLSRQPHPMPEGGATGGSVDSITKPFDETRSTYDGDQHSSATFDERFAMDPRLENANVAATLRPTFEMGYENRGYLDRSTFTSRTGSPWESAGAGAPLGDDSDWKSPADPGEDSGDGGSDSTLELKRPFGASDEDGASDTIPVYEGVAAQRPAPSPPGGVLSARSADPFPRQTPSVASDDYFQQGRTRSQPLETAM